MRIVASSQREAVEAARIIQQGMNSVAIDTTKPSIEQMTLIQQLSWLRDNIEIESPPCIKPHNAI